MFTDRLECCDWVTPYQQIDEAILFRTRPIGIPCYVLRIKSKGQIYQFGLNPGKYWAGELPFPVKRETVALKVSWFSLAIRLAAIAALLYLLWRRYQ